MLPRQLGADMKYFRDQIGGADVICVQKSIYLGTESCLIEFGAQKGIYSGTEVCLIEFCAQKDVFSGTE